LKVHLKKCKPYQKISTSKQLFDPEETINKISLKENVAVNTRIDHPWLKLAT
jgi:hypothetical protein